MRIGFGLKGTVLSAALLVAAVLLFRTAYADETLCHYCGMEKSKFGHSWMVIEYDSGKNTQVCSIHCAAIDMVLNKDNLINSITVGEYHSQKAIDAYKAYWVIGGDRSGVMTTRAKWAFDDEASATLFMQDHGGKAAVFEEVIRVAFEDLYEDTMAIKRKRKMMKMETGDGNN